MVSGAAVMPGEVGRCVDVQVGDHHVIHQALEETFHVAGNGGAFFVRADREEVGRMVARRGSLVMPASAPLMNKRVLHSGPEVLPHQIQVGPGVEGNRRAGPTCTAPGGSTASYPRSPRCEAAATPAFPPMLTGKLNPAAPGAVI